MKFRVFLYIVLISIFISILYFNKNADFVYGILADNAYKKNDITKAQELYEKSFSLGNTSSKQREVYVNSIINTPLTLDSQEKLITIAEDKIQDSASVKAKNFLDDLRIELHKKYQDNYIAQAPYNQKIVRWNRYPITYYFSNSQNVPEYFIEEIEKAFLEWERNSTLMFQRSNNPSSDITIEFNQLKKEDIEFGRKYVVAYTVPLINQNLLKNMTINFYTQTPNGDKFTKNQVYNNALHEVFHALGFLGHSYNPNDIMYLSKEAGEHLDDKRDYLNDSDISTLKLLYSIKPDITNDFENMSIKSEYLPYVVLGARKNVTETKTQEAKNYIRQAPSLPTGYIDLAENLSAEKNYSAAIKYLEKALNLADNDDVKYIIYYNLAVTYLNIEHTNLALFYADAAEEINNNEELHFLKAEIYLKAEDIEKAKEEYEYLIQIAPDNLNYIIRYANIYLNQKQYLKARKILKEFLNKHPQERNNRLLQPYKRLFI